MDYERIKKITVVLLCAFFVLGTGAGVFLADVQGPNAVEFGEVRPAIAVLGCFGPVFAAISAGLTVYCRAAYPVIFFCRGLGAAYSVSVIYGADTTARGLLRALGIIGPRTALLLCGLAVLCMDAYAKTLGGKRKPEGEQCYAPDKAFVRRSLICVCFAAAAALCVIYLSPRVALALDG
ncbi:MAG: hypothetical protein IJY86_10975 [Clostridia bacterium]|nr:hypothetical protein [Clostridia bacterium]